MSTVDDMEEVVEKTAQWAADIIAEVTEALSPGGRPFGFLATTPEEDMNNYLKLRGNPAVWSAYIDGKAQDMIAQLTQSRVPPEKIATIRPYTIVLKYILNWGAEMEEKYMKSMMEGVE